MPIESLPGTHEKEPVHSVVIADFLRHGESQYLETQITAHDPKAERQPDLTDRGRAEIAATAGPIIDAIDPANEIVVLWDSPAWRTQTGSEVIRKLLERRGIEVYKTQTIESMRALDIADPTFLDRLKKQEAGEGRSMEALYSNHPDLQEKNSDFETIGEVHHRAHRVYNALRHLAEHAKLQGKILHVIGVTHFEFLNPIVEEMTRLTIEEGQGVKKGESVRMTFDYDPATKKTTLSADFRNEHIAGLILDPESRFIRREEGEEWRKDFRELAPAPLWGATLEVPGTADDFKKMLLAAAQRTDKNHFGYFLYPAGGTVQYHLSKYPRRKYGPIPSDDAMRKQLSDFQATTSVSCHEQHIPTQPRFRVVFGLEEGYGTGKFRTLEQVAAALGKKFNLTRAEVFTAKRSGDAYVTYQEPAVMIQGYTNDIEAVYRLAELFGQERFAVDDFGSQTSHIVETRLCTSRDIE